MFKHKDFLECLNVRTYMPSKREDDDVIRSYRENAVIRSHAVKVSKIGRLLKQIAD